jgi:hypothetical protein
MAGSTTGLFAAPNGSYAPWLESLRTWREQTRAAIGLAPGEHGEVFDVASLSWTQTSYIQPQVHTFDLMLWNETSGRYTVDRYVDDAIDRYGGMDSVLLWPTYPNIGLDDRNQFDLIRLANLSDAVAGFHRRGVKVLLPYNPWDIATRREGKPDWDVLAALGAELGADGFNGDTMRRVPREFWSASVAAGRPMAIEPEGGGYPDTTSVADEAQFNSSRWMPLGWAYLWEGILKADNETTKYLPRPGVDRGKWLDPEGRHLSHVTDRWRKERLVAIRLGFFNGEGISSWENVPRARIELAIY